MKSREAIIVAVMNAILAIVSRENPVATLNFSGFSTLLLRL